MTSPRPDPRRSTDMFATLAAAMLVTLAPQRQTDTTIAVPAGASLSVNNFGGGITVHGWSENRVKVHAETGRRGRVEVSLVGNTVVVKASSREGAPSVMDFDISVPQSMGISLSGTYADITVDGMQGPISAETVNGEVNVRGGKGNITLHSIQGSVTLADASGRIEVNSVNENIELTNVSGEIKVETTNGDIDASFPLPMVPSPAGKHRKTFKIGSGSARMELESFQGDIEMRRPQEMRDRIDRKHKEHDENENDNDNDTSFSFDASSVTAYATKYAAAYAPKYAAQYAAQYAPKYARQYARMYSHQYK